MKGFKNIQIIKFEDNDKKWDAIKNALIITSKNTLGKCQNKKKKQWITEEILELMEMRRRYKNIDKHAYNATHREI